MSSRTSEITRPATGSDTGERLDGYLPIERYGAIGDGRAFALVGVDGSIDWMCLPTLAGPSVFGALLDPERGGRFTVQPRVPFEAEQRYLERTNVLQTIFRTEGGEVCLSDALTLGSGGGEAWRELIRQLDAVSGSVPMQWRVEPRFDYGRRAADFQRRGPMQVAAHEALQLGLRTWDAGPANVRAGALTGAFELEAGQRATLVMTATDDEPLPAPSRHAAERRLQETAEMWRTWVSRSSYDGPWRAAVDRSLLAIRLLADGRTGAIAAAGTTSLPEALGGDRNYDYRYGWVRDLCFTLDALLSVGMDELTQASISWLLRATRRTHPRVDPIYELDGEVLRGQHSLELPGYRRTGPVRVGNQAGSQLQLGGFGDLIETVSAYVSAGHVLGVGTGERLADIADLLARIWRSDDSGFWELGDRAQYGTSKLGVWVAFDRLLKLVDRGHVPPRNVGTWRRTRDDARNLIGTELFSVDRNSYLLKAGSDALDCSMLLAARRGFGDAEGQRMNGTIDAILRELHAGGPLFYRYSGMQESENAFVACSFWMVEAMARAGRPDEAAELMDGIVGLAGEAGLYSEEMEPGTHAMRGNLPQALSHLSLIRAASSLAQTSS